MTDNVYGAWDECLRLVANYPLCIPETSIPTSIEALIGVVTSRAEKFGEELDTYTHGDQYKKLAQEMIDAWDRGELPTKGEAKARFGRGRGIAEWQALWQALALARPLASKAGRRSGKNR